MEQSANLPTRSRPLTADAILDLPADIVGAIALHGLRELIFAPVPKLASAFSELDREQLSAAIEILIAMLDDADGDPDLEDIDEREAIDECEPEEDFEDIDEREPEDHEDEFSDRLLRLDHRRRLQRDRCILQKRYVRRWNGEVTTRDVGFRLLREPVVPTRRQLLRRKRGVPRKPRG